MESMLKMMQESPYVWAVGMVLSIGLAIYFGVKGNKYQRITYTKKTNKLISLKKVAVKALHLYFNEEEITDVSVTRIAVWNSGNERIDAKDIVAIEPLRICIKEGCEKTTRILDCSVDYVSEASIFENANIPQIGLEKDYYPIPFDYIASSNGMIVQIIHTGEANDVYLDCHIKGGRKTIELVDESGFYTTMVDLNDLPIIRKFTKLLKKLKQETKVSKIQVAIYYLTLILVPYTIALMILENFNIDNTSVEGLKVMLLLFLLIPCVYIIIYLFYALLFNRIPGKLKKEF